MHFRLRGTGPQGQVDAKFNRSGGLVVGPGTFDDTVFNKMAVADQAYHFFPPKVGKQFCITGFFVFATKDVSDASDTNIIIYEADSTTSTTVDKTTYQFGMPKLSTASKGPVLLTIGEGKFLNAKTDDNTVDLTIEGHYIQAV